MTKATQFKRLCDRERSVTGSNPES